MRRLLAIFAIIAFMSFGLAAVAHTYEVAVSPQVDENLLGEDHTVTVTIEPALIEGDSVIVEFYIDEGPNEEDYATVVLTTGETQATFTYTGDGGSGVDIILVQVTLNEIVIYSPSDYPPIFKLWLTDKVSGGGSIVQELEDAKKKDFNKISWGGWAGTFDYGEGESLGSINVTFHNVSNDELDKAKFVNYDFTGELELGIGPVEHIEYFAIEEFNPCPPESLCNAAIVEFPGLLLDEYDEVLSDCELAIYALDSGEPGVGDAIAFELDCPGDLYDYFSPVDFEEIYPPGFVRELNSGDLQTVCLPPPIP